MDKYPMPNQKNKYFAPTILKAFTGSDPKVTAFFEGLGFCMEKTLSRVRPVCPSGQARPYRSGGNIQKRGQFINRYENTKLNT